MCYLLKSFLQLNLLIPSVCLLLTITLQATADSSTKSISQKTVSHRKSIYQTRANKKSRQSIHQKKITVKRIPYRGWQDALFIGNGTVEAVVVPSINRVMQFRFVNEEGVFWENDALAGEAVDPNADGWRNFGGDKTWIAPQSDWQAVTNRKTPTVTFNAMPAAVNIKKNGIELVSQIDKDYGIRARRLVKLDARKSVMTIETVYEKLNGEPRRVSLWIITQLKEPLGIFVPVPGESVFESGYTKLRGLPPSLKSNGGILSLTRDPAASHKIGADSDRMIWINEHYVLRIASPRVKAAAYPDRSSSVEIYTSQNPLAYVELETLSPLKTMRVGDTLSRTNTYTLKRRSKTNLNAEAKDATTRK